MIRIQNIMPVFAFPIDFQYSFQIFFCRIPVIQLQIDMRNLAQRSLVGLCPLPAGFLIVFHRLLVFPLFFRLPRQI